MTPTGPEANYHVHNSGAIKDDFLRLQVIAARQGRGDELLRAGRAVFKRLQTDPWAFGEPLYRLSALRMQVRSAVIAPLAIDFAVSEDRSDVYIKSVRLLGRRG